MNIVPSTNAEELGIDDLLMPELPSINGNIEGKHSAAQSPLHEKNIDELLGPKDIFPFLPDNHRDSGTGKFNSF